MTRQTWTAFVAAVAFVLASAGIVLIPVPFVSWAPGGVTDTLGRVAGTPVIRISGTTTYPTAGRLDLTTVSETRADARVSLPQALLAYWRPGRDALPRDVIYPPGKTPDQVEGEQRVMMETSQDHAVVAALRAAGKPVTERPAVASVRVGSPAYNKLQPGDLIMSINGTAVTGNRQAADLIRAGRPGSSLVFEVFRNRQPKVVRIARGSTDSGDLSGITIGDGYAYRPRISFDLGEQIGGPSAGLIFSLAIYDKITPGSLVAGRRIAGTGTIDADGRVGPIGGIQEKITAAGAAGATVFLVPAPNCADLAGLHTRLDLVRVDSLRAAVSALQDLRRGDRAALPRCR